MYGGNGKEHIYHEIRIYNLRSAVRRAVAEKLSAGSAPPQAIQNLSMKLLLTGIGWLVGKGR